MVETKKCSFTGKPIPPGTGMMYVKKTGQVLYFINSKAKKNKLFPMISFPRRTSKPSKHVSILGLLEVHQVVQQVKEFVAAQAVGQTRWHH